MSELFTNTLLEKLLLISIQKEQNLFKSIVDTIQTITQCQICSLWSINSNTTNRCFNSASLMVRKYEEDISHASQNIEDYVQSMNKSPIERIIIKTEQSNQSYCISDISEYNKLRSEPFFERLNPKKIIGIPICNQENTSNIAVLELAFTKEPQINQLELFASVIRDTLSSYFARYMLLKKQNMMQELIDNYKANGAKNDIKDIFNPIINSILCNYCSYEAASLYIRDSYINHFRLLSTTEKLKNHNIKDYSQAGEGLTGHVVLGKRTRIYDDLRGINANDHHIQEKYIVDTQRSAKTLMVTPIIRPSKPDEVIGLLQFINKKNQVNPDVVDYFNDSDAEIMDNAASYLGLIIDYYLGEEERSDFVSKMSHEISSPANAIRISADRLLNKIGDPLFQKRYLITYLENISESSKLLLEQTNSIRYTSKIRTNIPLFQKYSIEKCWFKDILLQSKNIVIPFARDQGVRFDNIKIDTDFPDWALYIDKTAFITVFYNLLTNAIKYRNSKEEFSVDISGKEVDHHLKIEISDKGLGIATTDKDQIFLMGYRGENVIKYDSTGFGIGLLIVKDIIQDFGGTIYVSSLQNPTTFVIELPSKLFSNKYFQETKWQSRK